MKQLITVINESLNQSFIRHSKILQKLVTKNNRDIESDINNLLTDIVNSHKKLYPKDKPLDYSFVDSEDISITEDSSKIYKLTMDLSNARYRKHVNAHYIWCNDDDTVLAVSLYNNSKQPVVELNKTYIANIENVRNEQSYTWAEKDGTETERKPSFNISKHNTIELQSLAHLTKRLYIISERSALNRWNAMLLKQRAEKTKQSI